MPLPNRPSLPARSASLPPIHLSSDQADDELGHPPPVNDGRPDPVAVSEPNNAPFPWNQLPKEIQQNILHKALLPSGLASPAPIIGKPAHREHMHNTAIPILLGLGTWAAYTAAARILYSEVHLVLFLYPEAAMHFLTSPNTLHLRRFVSKLQLRIDIEHDLCLFDEGWRAATSVPEATVNIPTALHSMRVHGRLREVHFLLNVSEIIYHRDPNPTTGKERTVSAYYLPVARLQLAHWETAVWDRPGAGSSRGVQPGKEVIAPVFLAGRAFQYGLLPLLLDGVMEKSSFSLEVVSKDGKSRVEETDARRLFRYWLGATILEVLNKTKALEIARGKWVDPFAVARRAKDSDKATVLQQGEAGGVEKPAANLIDDGESHEVFDTNAPEPDAHRSVTHFQRHPERIGYKSRGDDLQLSSPIRYDSPTPSSVTSGEDVTMDLDSYVRAAAGEDEGVRDREVDRDPRMDDPSQPDDPNDNSELFSSCLEKVILQATADETIDSMEQSQTRGKASISILPRGGGHADTDSSDDEEVPLRKPIDGLDCDRQAVIKSVGSENPTPSRLHSDDTDSDSSSDSESYSKASEDEYPPSRSTAFNRKEPSLVRDTADNASWAPQDSDEDGSESDASASSSFDDHVTAPPTVKVPHSVARPKPKSLASPREHDNSSPSSDSDSSSSSSDDETAGKKRGLMANIIGSSRTERGEGAKAGAIGATGERIDSAERRKDAATLPVENQSTRGRSTSTTPPSPNSKRSKAQDESTENLLATPTTAFRPVNMEVVASSSVPARAPPSQQATAHNRSDDSATTGQKRKAPQDAPEATKKSKNARRRARRRARVIARMADEA